MRSVRCRGAQAAFRASRRRPNTAAAAAPNSRITGGAGTSWPPLELLVVPPVELEPVLEDEELVDELPDPPDDVELVVLTPPVELEVEPPEDEDELLEVELLPEEELLEPPEVAPLDVAPLEVAPPEVELLPDEDEEELEPPLEVEDDDPPDEPPLVVECPPLVVE